MTNTISSDDRLTMAFEVLDGQDIFTKERYWCCQSCGCAALENDADPESRGYVFYHEQDAENKDAGQDFYLAFGTISGKQTAEQIGAEIVATLKAHGIGTDWNGDAATRIRVLWKYQG